MGKSRYASCKGATWGGVCCRDVRIFGDPVILFPKPCAYYSWFHYGPFIHMHTRAGRGGAGARLAQKEADVKLAVYLSYRCLRFFLPSNLAPPF